MEKMYIQGDTDIEETLKHIGIDDLRTAELICGWNIYALEVDYYDGDYGRVIALHSYTNNAGYTILTNDNGQLLDKIVKDQEFMRDYQEEKKKFYCQE